MKAVSTYRFQFNSQFTFKMAASLVDYLADLGVTTLYASPVLQAGAGSTHGYDVTDPTRLNPELGSPADFEHLSEQLRSRQMSLLLDIVPNHMKLSPDNPWLWDLLKNGPRSRYAPFFAVDWTDPKSKVVLPILGGEVEELVRKREIRLDFWNDEGFVIYYDWKLPLKSGVSAEGLNPSDNEVLKILDQQFYKLIHWKEGGKHRNYRRFFDIDQLIALNTENPDVFEALHQLPLRLYSEGKVQGFRIDHIDGLKKPTLYLKHLNEQMLERQKISPYVLVEKILSESEKIPEHWPIQGTTGYEFLNQLIDLFVDWDRIDHFEQVYREQAPRRSSFLQVERRAKIQVLNELFSNEFAKLLEQLTKISTSLGENFPEDELRDALLQLSISLPVYRTYFDEEAENPQDATYLEEAARDARKTLTKHEGLNFLVGLFTLRVADPLLQYHLRNFILKWQQFTGPLMAKGHEDTALYRYNRLLCLNEVGGNPGKSKFSLEDFHEFNRYRAESFPLTLNATSTHDTKRSEDMRARIAVLSEIPELWEEHLQKWFAMNERKKEAPDAPAHNMEIFIYQTLLGVWPLDGAVDSDFQSRIKAYIQKAAKEAKIYTNWLSPSEPYEKALMTFIDRILDPLESQDFLDDFQSLLDLIQFPGAVNSLSQVVLKSTCPGIPDFYQGSELWDFSLVDPDNRRPVDYAARIRLLEDLRSSPTVSSSELLKDWRSGLIKLHLTAKLSETRRKDAELFLKGTYEKVPIEGPWKANAFAFVRRFENRAIAVFVPRLLSHDLDLEATLLRGKASERWKDSWIQLPETLRESGFKVWKNLFVESHHLLFPNDGRLKLSEAFEAFPIGVFISRSA